MAAVAAEAVLSNGRKIPLLGLGTWKAGPGKVTQAVKDAIDVGYRHFDTAYAYENEELVGAGLKAKFLDGTVKRQDIFVTSKVWSTHHARDDVMESCRKSVATLGLQYLDLYLVHWPFAFKKSDSIIPRDQQGKLMTSDVDFMETWQGMEDCLKIGLVQSIGVSNFNSEQLQRVLDEGEIKPVVNQIECHPYLTQKELIKFCTDRGIAVTGYSPLGSPTRPWKDSDDPSLLDQPELAQIAKNHGKNVAQVLIRYQVQRNVICIPRSVTRSRIEDNFKVFDFELTAEEVATIEELNRSWRACAFPWAKDVKYYPFNIPY